MSQYDSQTYSGATEGGKISAPILDFRNRIQDLARPNLFQVEIGFPGILDDGSPSVGGATGTTENATQSEAGKSKAGATYTAGQSGRIGYDNPNIQTALTNLLRSSNNAQLNNMFSSYVIQPNVRGNRATVAVGSPNLKKITSTKLKTK